MWKTMLGVALLETPLPLPLCPATPIAGPWHTPVVFGSALAIGVLATLWALLERSERRTYMKQSAELSNACRAISEQHYRERVQAEERHLLAHDSTVRNILESLERALLGKPRY